MYSGLGREILKYHSSYDMPLLPNRVDSKNDFKTCSTDLCKRSRRIVAVTDCSAQLTLTFYKVSELNKHKECFENTRVNRQIKILRKANLSRGWIATTVQSKHSGHGMLKLKDTSIRRAGLDILRLQHDISEHNMPMVCIQSKLRESNLEVPIKKLRHLLNTDKSDKEGMSQGTPLFNHPLPNLLF